MHLVHICIYGVFGGFGELMELVWLWLYRVDARARGLNVTGW